MTLSCDVYRITRAFPTDEQYGITSQLRRAAVSVTCNIAEGHGRATRGEFLNHLSIARGSANELDSLLQLSELLGVANEATIAPIRSDLDQILRMLARMRSRLRESL